MRARWIVLPAVLVLVAGELAAPPGPAVAVEPSAAAAAAQPELVADAVPDAGTAASSTTYLAVSAGALYTCAIRADHTLICWGDGGYGQAIPPTGTFSVVSAGGDHACAIRTNGTLACWGRDAWGESTPPTGVFTAVSAGNEHNCAIRPDRTLACWGLDTHGSAAPPAGTFTSVSAGISHTCGVRTGGALACWGSDYNGKATPPSGTFLAVAAGPEHTCAIRTDGTLTCWGYYDDARSRPPAGTFTVADAGDYYTCALRSDRTAACWGRDYYGEVSPPAGMFSTVSAGTWHTCGLRTDGALACWGRMVPQPKSRLDPLPAWLVGTTVSLHWGATPASAPVTSYEIRYRRTRWNGSYGPRLTWRSETTDTSATFTASPGYTYCFDVRAWDADGMASQWSTPRCTAIPLDDRSLVRSSSWVAGTGTAYYRHTYLQGRYSGAKLTRTGVRAKQIALLATTCPTCGTVGVYWNSTLLKTVSLFSATTLNKQLIPVATFSSARTGTLTIRIVGGGKPVIIDGVAIRRT